MNNRIYVTELTDFTPREVNELRRLVMSKIFTVAITEVTFNTNTSSINDEIIAHRLGMVTIKIPDSYIDQKINFDVEVECLGNSLCLTSDYLKMEGLQVAKNIPIVILSQGQKISMTCIATKGCGENHARWSPVTMCVYNPIPETLNNFRFEIHVNEPFNAQEIFKKALKIFHQ